jgi:hypothetical protein
MRACRNGDAVYLAFDAGPHGYYHGHLDLFSITLFGGTRELLPEPGVYAYVISPERIGFRSTACHNTLSLDYYDHRPYEDDGDEPLAFVTQWDVAEDGAVCVSAHHRAYDHLWGEPVIYRQVFFDGTGVFVLVDRILCAHPGASRRPHALTASFNLPDVDHADVDQEAACARTTFATGSNLFVRTLDRWGLSLYSVHPGKWQTRDGDLQENTRVVPVLNADRGVMVHVLRVAEGPARPLTGTHSGAADGTVRVEVSGEGLTGLALDFELERVLPSA